MVGFGIPSLDILALGSLSEQNAIKELWSEVFTETRPQPYQLRNTRTDHMIVLSL